MSYIHFPDLVLHTVGRLAKYPQHCLWCVKSDEIDENVTHSLQISFHRSVQAHTISFVSYFLFLSAYRPPSARNMHLIAPGSTPHNNQKKEHPKILRRMMMAMASGFFSTLHNLKPNSLPQQSARLHPHLFDAVTWKPPSKKVQPLLTWLPNIIAVNFLCLTLAWTFFLLLSMRYCSTCQNHITNQELHSTAANICKWVRWLQEQGT